MNAVSIAGSEEFEVLSPSCIEIVQQEKKRIDTSLCIRILCHCFHWKAKLLLHCDLVQSCGGGLKSWQVFDVSKKKSPPRDGRWVWHSNFAAPRISFDIS
ncbi:hypothetical protein AVEN_203183-1 [Araneus ventricosus]|uniref:Uncharacterized protein n=1 Tax=Araneus ventricosus TaxID=182803 RepID=A0A4Y2CGY0_ARAVE|nr:hypothetical protein AVEN_203183-1 [Araneus ventricosus]